MLVILRFPHLVLADVGDDYRVAVARFVPQIVDHVRGVEMAVVGQILNIADGGIALQPPTCATHSRRSCISTRGISSCRICPQIADKRHIHFHVLVDFGGIDINVNFLRVLSVSFQAAGHAVVEPHAESEQQIGVLNRFVHPCFAVHAHHSEIQRMRRREGRRGQAASSRREWRCVRRMPELPASAPEIRMPWPARITGRFASRIRFSAFS